jgi:chemotaxis response regulator CheB
VLQGQVLIAPGGKHMLLRRTGRSILSKWWTARW